MKLRELTIGNYYNYNNSTIKLDGSLLATYLQNDAEFRLIPIPITQEWLVKFGFKEYGKCYYKDELYLKKIDFQPIGEEETDIIFYKLEYVHQLQNLYFALTNEELTLNK
jgi:hypothetical protein